ncbi:Pyridoxal-5'-phosphate-dependent enzyme family protein [Dorcoceras hygrometricum]|uniref:Pyridoxal-5'-phosphate-dependent enzyme family protein n=1 Tax=Dorcoceras hygrometricum TaxID=472368 RepID=A0A2Z7AXX1_9LAMI|nr:Pyridoxal-5'-phosphate-dependent enzyme family protein [Dorcoceras hygrometricum]
MARSAEPWLDVKLHDVSHVESEICFWKFGLQCPTSPLLPPRKVSLEDFDGYRISANTHPHKQHLYGLLDSLTSHADFAAGYKCRKDVFELLHKASSLQTQSNDIQ